MWSIFSRKKLETSNAQSDMPSEMRPAESGPLVEWVQANISQAEGTVDLVAEAESVLTEYGFGVKRVDNDLYLPEAQLTFSPRGLQITSPEKSVRTVTIVRTSHKTLPSGLFEFQHGIGETLRDALRFGLTPWAQIDVPVLIDATLLEPKTCMVMTLEHKEKSDRPNRRVIFGPTQHWAKNPLPQTCEDETANSSQDGAHCFCPCCLFMNSHEAFQPLIESEETFALRLYAARDEEGDTMADCRVNGIDYEEGKIALLAYVQKWPQQGFEFRKQYVLIQPSPS